MNLRWVEVKEPSLLSFTLVLLVSSTELNILFYVSAVLLFFLL